MLLVNESEEKENKKSGYIFVFCFKKFDSQGAKNQAVSPLMPPLFLPEIRLLLHVPAPPPSLPLPAMPSPPSPHLLTLFLTRTSSFGLSGSSPQFMLGAVLAELIDPPDADWVVTRDTVVLSVQVVHRADRFVDHAAYLTARHVVKGLCGEEVLGGNDQEVSMVKGWLAAGGRAGRPVEVLARWLEGAGVGVLVAGGSGAGKTALVREVARCFALKVVRWWDVVALRKRVEACAGGFWGKDLEDDTGGREDVVAQDPFAVRVVVIENACLERDHEVLRVCLDDIRANGSSLRVIVTSCGVYEPELPRPRLLSDHRLSDVAIVAPAREQLDEPAPVLIARASPSSDPKLRAELEELCTRASVVTRPTSFGDLPAAWAMCALAAAQGLSAAIMIKIRKDDEAQTADFLEEALARNRPSQMAVILTGSVATLLASPSLAPFV